jgi:hypothetical protein
LSLCEVMLPDWRELLEPARDLRREIPKSA